MIKKKVIFAIVAITTLSISLFGCNNQDSNKKINDINSNISTDSETNNTEEKEEVPSTSNNSETQQSTNNTEVTESTQETDTPDSITKIKGRKEFIEKLDNIQKELDALPEKKDSDAGITNAMKNYYGKSYEEYDKALNEIYNLLKENLSADVMEDLKIKQIEWINQKETTAREEEAKYKGGTLEFVSGYVSLYESTKERCYELVNEYMED